jgi:hypothetical protein
MSQKGAVIATNLPQIGHQLNDTAASRFSATQESRVALLPKEKTSLAELAFLRQFPPHAFRKLAFNLAAHKKTPDDAGAFDLLPKTDQYLATTGPPNLYAIPTVAICVLSFN